MSTSFDDDRAKASGRRRVKLLGLAAGAVLGMSIVALGAHDVDAAKAPAWADDAPALPPHVAEPTSVTVEHLAARDTGVDWQRAEQWSEFGPAAVAAYER